MLLDGCCELPSGQNNGLAQQALVVVGNQLASLCSEPPQAGTANAYLPSVAIPSGFKGGLLLALTPPHPSHQILVNLEISRNCVLLDIQLVKLLGILLLENLWSIYGNAMSLRIFMIQAGWSSASLQKLICSKFCANALTLFKVSRW